MLKMGSRKMEFKDINVRNVVRLCRVITSIKPMMLI